MSNYSRQYTSGINWQNFTNTSTPLSAGNLNRMDNAIINVDRAVEVAVNSKADSSTVNNTIKGVSYDAETGVFTFTFVNDTTVAVNTVLEKVVTNFTYDPETQRLILTLADGSVQYIDMSALITQYEFTDSATIAWTIGSGSGGKNKLKITAVSATVGGINYTVNPDGTVTANGIASIDSVFPLSAAFETAEQSVLSGCPDGGGAETYEIQYGTYSDTGSSVVIPSGEAEAPSIVIRSGVEVTNLVFRPMITLKTVHDISPDFVPYLASGAVYASVKKGSITGEYLEPDYLAHVTAQTQAAQGYAQSAATDADRAENAADAAEGYRDEVKDAVQDFTGATTLSDGKHGLVPKPLQSANPQKKVLRSDGTWGEVESVPNGGTAGQVLAKKTATDGDTEWINPGHEILNASGTEMARRQKLQFVGAAVTDDARNGKTIITTATKAGDVTATDTHNILGQGTTADATDAQDMLDEITDGFESIVHYGASGGTGPVITDPELHASDVDDELSATSENPVQNKVVKGAIDELAVINAVSAVAFNHRVDRNWDGLGGLAAKATDVTADFDNGMLSQKIAACNFDDYDLGMQIKKTITIDGTARVAHIIFAHANAFFGYSYYAMVDTPNIACVVYVEGLTGKWNTSDTGGAYMSSYLRIEIQKVIAALKSVLGESHMVAHQVLLSNVTSGGKSSGWAWVADSYGEAMSAAQMCGTEISGSLYDTGEAYEQLALFKEVRPNQVGGNSYYPWLRDVLTASYAAGLGDRGHLSGAGVTDARCVSPLILLK